ncbi:MAG: type IV pilus twitching motility protein PilT [Candidatus Nanopelagicales bacterium]|nr:type IV pilus twitching motility protein PilT [Candidatus Nanopelagicales bacterium]
MDDDGFVLPRMPGLPTANGAIGVVDVHAPSGPHLLPGLLPVEAITSRIDAPQAPPPVADVGIRILEPDASASQGIGIQLDDILLVLLERGASDLHLSVNAPPMIRVNGDLEALPGHAPLTPKDIREAMYAILSDRQKQAFEETKELDLAYELPGAARFRVNLLQQQGSIGAVLRSIPWEIRSLEELSMPPSLAALTALPRGLVLVTGPTGSGKSTTLAALVDRVNRTRKGHIITIEDPIEFVHPHKGCVVNQREVGTDTRSFAAALRHALRQDPDVMLVGEMRDLETIAIALTAAETGHLVFATLHTSSAASTIDRIIDVFPAEQQAQIRTQLASSLEAVVCQTLCRTSDGSGRIAATEVLIATPAIRNLVREGKLQSIPSALQTGSRHGMHTLNQRLAELVASGRVAYDEAREHCSDPDELAQLLGRSADDAD